MTYPDGTEALVDADLTVHAGETVALVGESGSGKTTLLRTLNRRLEPTAGRLEVGGRPMAELDPIALRRRTGYVQQEGGLLPHWTVLANVELVPRLLGWDRARRRRRAREVLELVGLSAEEHGGRHPRELSGGQRQRVAIARALAADPPVILLDEPFGALDALTRRELQGQFQELQRRLAGAGEGPGGDASSEGQTREPKTQQPKTHQPKTRQPKTLVLVTHDLGEAFRLAHRVAVLRRGRILRTATPEELVADPGHPYVEALLDSGLGHGSERGEAGGRP